jgi:hypothetical protein
MFISSKYNIEICFSRLRLKKAKALISVLIITKTTNRMCNSIELNARITEIAERMEKGMTTGEILEEYMPKWSASHRTIDRYIALAKDIIAKQMTKKQAIIEASRAEIIEASVERLASNLEIEARLCEIVLGNYETDKVVRGKDGSFIKVGCNPSPRDAMKAAEMLFEIRKEHAKEAEKIADVQETKRMMEGIGANIIRQYEESVAKRK